jgi:UDP-glucose 4-epimerase
MVTGGAGFIGSHIVDDLAAMGHEVVVYDNFSTGLRENIAQHGDRIQIVEGDLLDAPALERAMKGCEFVSHHAAQLEIFLSISKPEDDLTQNTVGTLNVLRAAKKAGVGHVINVSSACVYGQSVEPSREDVACTPNWAYGVSKLAAEKYAQIYNDYEGVPVTSLRYAIVYGEREWYRRVLPIFLKRVIQEKPPVVFGEGSQVRDFVHVADVVALNRRCFENPAARGKVFNVGSGMGTTIDRLAELVCNVDGRGLRPLREETREGEFSKLIPDKRRNSAELKQMLLDIAKAKQLLGWVPSISLTEGLRREYEWARTHLARWEAIRYTSH